MLKKNFLGHSEEQDLKKLYRRMVKALHPDLGGNKEEFIKFMEEFKFYKQNFFQSPIKKVEIVKNLPIKNNFIYRCEEFSLEELLGIKKKKVCIPIERKCYYCNGKGYDLNSTKICGRCQGTGLLRIEDKKETGQLSIKCFFCDGNGKVYNKKCIYCSGKGYIRDEIMVEVDIPLGVQEGDFLFLAKDLFNLPQDVYIEVFLSRNSSFKISGNDIKLELEINIWDLLLSDYIEISTLEGPEQIPTSILRENDFIILEKRGLFYYQDGSLKRGNLLIHFKIKMPKNIPMEVKEILQSAYNLYQSLVKEDKNG